MSLLSLAILRRCFGYFLPWATAVLLFTAYYHRAAVEQDIRRAETQDRAAVQIGIASLNFSLQQISSDLRTLAGFADLVDLLDRNDAHSLDDLTREFLNFSRARQRYDQIRWIDENGQEKLRVNFDARGVRAVPENELQNKADRYYFTATMALAPGEIYVSPLDLNIENGRIEEPYKPVIRIATPLADGRGKPRGILIINYLAQEMLGRFVTAMAPVGTRAMLLNADGYWLSSPRREDEWAFMFGRPESLATRQPAAWKSIRDSDSGQFVDASGLWTFATVYPLLELGRNAMPAPAAGVSARAVEFERRYRWKVVVPLAAETLSAMRLAPLAQTLAVTAATLLVLLFGTWHLAVARTRQLAAEEALRSSNLQLEQAVEERTRQLHVEVFDRQLAERRYRESTEQYRRMLATMRDAYWLCDQDGALLDVNDAACSLLGYSRDELLNLTVGDIEARESPEALAARIRQVGVRGHDRFETLHRRKDGQLIAVEVSVSYLSEYQRHVSLIRDITERKKVEAERRLAALVLENTDEGVVICNADLEVISVNPACERITGYSAGEMLGDSPARLAVRSANMVLEIFLGDLMHRLEKDGSWRGELSARRKSGEVFPVWLNVSVVRDAEQGIAYYVGVFSDITPIKESQERIAFLAHHDALTGLPNRLLFGARLEHGIERARRDGRAMAVLFIDLDRFKEVNDSLGHATGDQLLKDLAAAMGAGLRREDTLARLGGDEFVILLEEVDGHAAVDAVLQKIEQVFPWPVAVGERVIDVTASIGIAIFPGDGKDAEALVHSADQAMYAVKAAGRAGHRYAGDLDAASAQPARSAPSATSQ